MKYRKRIMVSLTVILVVPILLNNVMIFSAVRRHELELKHDYIGGQTKQLRDTVDYILAKLLSDLVFLSGREELRDLRRWYETSDYRAKKEFLNEFYPVNAFSAYYDQALLILPDDDIMIDLKNKMVSTVAGSRHRERISRSIELYDRYRQELLRPAGDALGTVAFLVKAIPIPERGTRMLLYMELSDNLFKGVLDDIFLIDRSFAVIANHDSTVVQFRSKNVGFSLEDVEPVVRAAGDGTSVVEGPNDTYLVCSMKSQDLDWTYHYGISYSAVDREIWLTLLRYTLFAGAILAVFLVVIQYISRGMYQPVLDVAGLLQDGGDAADDVELKDLQANIRNLIARNRELSVSAGTSAMYERERLLRALVLDGDFDEAALADRIASLGMDIELGEGVRYAVFTGITTSQEMQRRISSDAFRGVRDSEFFARFRFSEGVHSEHFTAEGRNIVFVVSSSAGIPLTEVGLGLGAAESPELSFYLGISGVHDGPAGLRDAYRESLIALEYRSLFKGRWAVAYDEVISRERTGYFYPIEIEQKLISSIKQLDSEGVKEQLAVLSDTIAIAGISFPNARRLYSHLLDSLMLITRDFNLASDGPDGDDSGSVWNTIEHAEGMKRIEDEVLEYCLRLVRRLQSTKESPMVTLANAVKSYVDRNYRNRNLSLDLLSDELSYSVSHLSTVFKNTFGETIKDYITGLRLEKACELLVKTDMKISSVSAEVGYDNFGSFVKIFKAYLGETPKAYRLRIHRG
jgi:AraC-like DNA-binding protein